ncbi:hypothetical protein JYU12_02660 [bacterium AH-315-K03]|nr:hypothetical protein [bacterium AH-315-K03]
MNKSGKLALLYLASLCFLAWGFGIGKYQYFPYAIFEELMTYSQGGDGEEVLSLAEKIANDMEFTPSRLLYTYEKNPNRDYKEVEVPNISATRDKPLIFQTNLQANGYRLVYGTFDFESNWHGAILLDGNGEVIHTWVIHEDGLDWDVRAKSNKSPHGFEVLSDGSIVVNYDGGESIQRFDWCGKRTWATPGAYHHSIHLDDDDTIWSLEGWGEYFKDRSDPSNISIVQLDVNTGNILKKIRLSDIKNANPDSDILGIRQEDSREKSEWVGDVWHPNDVEPLLESMASAFEQFSSNDLLVSVRSLNLIFVFDQTSLKIKWWRSGITRRQHDPDWNPSGVISVFDNNMHRGVSRIKTINPQNYHSTILYDGEQEGFYTVARGRHQLLGNGNILITIPLQGRVIEVSKTGKLVFEFINVYQAQKNRNLYIAESRLLPKSFFDFQDFPVCN